MNPALIHMANTVYKKCGIELLHLTWQVESKEYEACCFEIDRKKIICRTAKITPKKIGQFVTFWKRNNGGPIIPFHELDRLDFYVVNLQTSTATGQFIFPKAVLIKKGIISTDTTEGKRAFRVYPNWDTPKSKQAQQTQKWQLDYFYEVREAIDVDKLKMLFELEPERS